MVRGGEFLDHVVFHVHHFDASHRIPTGKLELSSRLDPRPDLCRPIRLADVQIGRRISKGNNQYDCAARNENGRCKPPTAEESRRQKGDTSGTEQQAARSDSGEEWKKGHATERRTGQVPEIQRLNACGVRRKNPIDKQTRDEKWNADCDIQNAKSDGLKSWAPAKLLNVERKKIEGRQQSEYRDGQHKKERGKISLVAVAWYADQSTVNSG